MTSSETTRRTRRPSAVGVDAGVVAARRWRRWRTTRVGSRGATGGTADEARTTGGAATTSAAASSPRVIIAVVGLAAFAAGRAAATFLVTVIVGVCAFELYEAFRRAGYHTATVIGLLGCVAAVPIAYNQGERGIVMVSVLVIVFTFFWYLFEVVHARPDREHRAHAARVLLGRLPRVVRGAAALCPIRAAPACCSAS